MEETTRRGFMGGMAAVGAGGLVPLNPLRRLEGLLAGWTDCFHERITIKKLLF